MACLDTTIITMYNHHHHQQQQNSDHPTAPRISFSNDFADSVHHRQQILKPNGPVSSDFEFSVPNYSMMTADELFFKGRLLPFKDGAGAGGQKTTLRDELLAGEDDEGAGVSFRPPKSSGSTRWKGFLGLRKSNLGSKRSDKGDESRSGSGQDDVHVSKTSQEMMNGGGASNCRDVEFRMQ